MDACQVEGCTRTVSKPGHQFCLDHWKAERAGAVNRCDACKRWHEGTDALCAQCARSPTAVNAGEEDAAGALLSSTKIGKHFGLSNIKTNLVLAELGWIEKYVKGWVPTDRGHALGANVKEARNGIPFVVWPESILTNAALLASVREQSAPVHAPPPPREGPAAVASAAKPAAAAPPPTASNFRDKFPATHRTQDGHMVRSRAEVLIDNWLYMQGIVHAYERRLPIEEECYCDFYLPKGKGVYIEFWGRESDPKYRDRMAIKRDIYTKYQLRLIELGDAEIERLDDVLPRMLLPFEIESV
jgi:hypothetical protein